VEVFGKTGRTVVGFFFAVKNPSACFRLLAFDRSEPMHAYAKTKAFEHVCLDKKGSRNGEAAS